MFSSENLFKNKDIFVKSFKYLSKKKLRVDKHWENNEKTT